MLGYDVKCYDVWRSISESTSSSSRFFVFSCLFYSPTSIFPPSLFFVPFLSLISLPLVSKPPLSPFFSPFLSYRRAILLSWRAVWESPKGPSLRPSPAQARPPDTLTLSTRQCARGARKCPHRRRDDHPSDYPHDRTPLTHPHRHPANPPLNPPHGSFCPLANPPCRPPRDSSHNLPHDCPRSNPPCNPPCSHGHPHSLKYVRTALHTCEPLCKPLRWALRSHQSILTCSSLQRPRNVLRHPLTGPRNILRSQLRPQCLRWPLMSRGAVHCHWVDGATVMVFILLCFLLTFVVIFSLLFRLFLIFSIPLISYFFYFSHVHYPSLSSLSR